MIPLKIIAILIILFDSINLIPSIKDEMSVLLFLSISIFLGLIIVINSMTGIKEKIEQKRIKENENSQNSNINKKETSIKNIMNLGSEKKSNQSKNTVVNASLTLDIISFYIAEMRKFQSLQM
mgnify:CR=1 FL=1